MPASVFCCKDVHNANTEITRSKKHFKNLG